MVYYVFEVEEGCINVVGSIDCGNDLCAFQEFIALIRKEYWQNWDMDYVVQNEYGDVVCRCRNIGNHWHFVVFTEEEE